MAGREHLICASTALAEGGGIRFEACIDGKQEPAFAIRHQGRAQAYLNRCAHVPVELDWNNGRFFDFSGLYLVCATHGALYAPDSGRCLGGRCNGRGLVKLDVIERDGGVYLNESEHASE